MMNRRQALMLSAALPLAARIHAQTRPTSRRRIVLGDGHAMLFEGGTLATWLTWVHEAGPAPDCFGLGHNRPVGAYTLQPVPGLTNVVAAAAGAACSFAVLGDGRLLAWGLNAGTGKLGTTPLATLETLASWGPNSNTPIPVVTKFDAVDVSCQSEHVLALARDGSVYSWGNGKNGRLGNGPLPVIHFKTRTPDRMTYVPFPVPIADLTNVIAVSAGAYHSLALLKDGTVRAWGSNKFGELGDGTTVDRDRPVPVVGVRNAVAVAAAGGAFSAALLADGTVMTWGTRANGVLGRPPWTDDDKPDPTPAIMPGVAGIRAIAAGSGHMLALSATGSVYSWGADADGQLGRGDNTTTRPGLIKGLSEAQSICASNQTSTAVLASGRVMTWGAVRPMARPGGSSRVSRSPILLALDGLSQP